MSSSTVTKYAKQACAALVGANSDSLQVKKLKIWQSEQVSDVDGAVSYVRYGVKKTTDVHFDAGLCEQAFNNFNNICKDDGGNTRGGEITVGKSIEFSVDPNQVGCNC